MDVLVSSFHRGDCCRAKTSAARCRDNEQRARCRTLEDLLGSREKEKEREEERDRPIISILPWRLTPHDSGLDEGLSKLGRCRRMIFDHGREREAEMCPVTL